MTEPTQHVRQPVRRITFLIGLLLTVVLMATACTLEVQPIEEYTTPDGYLSFTMPASWHVFREEAEAGMTETFVGSNPDAILPDVIPPGEAFVSVLLLPPFQPPPGGLAPAYAAEMRGSMALFQDDITDVTPETLDNGIEAYSFSVPSPEYDTTFHVLGPTEGVVVLVSVFTASGETDYALLAEADIILNSIQIGDEFIEWRDDYLEHVEQTLDTSD